MGVVAVVITSSAHAEVVFDWVTVGNPGNAADVNGRGSVEYAYHISKHEVTNAQFAEYLNKVATASPSGFYLQGSENFATHGITVTFSSGAYVYGVKPGRENNPVNNINWLYAARFVNWLHNGQPTGPGAGTESGVYDMSQDYATRAGGARFVIPSRDEWYKAAYHKADNSGYWDYATQSDSAPVSAPPSASSGLANYRAANDNYALSGNSIYNSSFNYLSDVGAYSGSPSGYGTFDQAGNVWEWTETISGSAPITNDIRWLMGGSFGSYANQIAAAHEFSALIGSPDQVFGFRVARAVPEPSGLLVLALAATPVAIRRRAGH